MATMQAPAHSLARAETPVRLGASILDFLLVVIQFVAVFALVDRFNLENKLFVQVVGIALGGFLVHYWLPKAMRLPFFVALSIGAVAYSFGLENREWRLVKSIQHTATLLGVGGALIGLCHLPVRYGVRVLLLILAGGGLAVFRGGWLSFGPLDGIWPVLGAMFMFRLMIYVYDIEHDDKRPKLSETLAYFFLFPAVWLFVFPVIDFRAFRANYFNHAPRVIYSAGVTWMFRGVVQLLLWRLIYYHGYLDPGHISNGTDLMQYLLSNVGLYLRVSGQFHFVIGLLHMFGFCLPESHRRYFLASSFTDYWRRINIYWKDFITKLVYYPVTMRLKSLSVPRRVLVGTACAFAVTWLLHAYQWFWLRGVFPLEPKDLLFWTAFGVVVTIAAMREIAQGRKRSLKRKVATWRDNLSLGVRTAATFMILMLLWSLWSCDTLVQWAGIWRFADGLTALYAALLFVAVGAAAILMEGPATPWVKHKLNNQQEEDLGTFPWRRALVTCLIPAGALYVGSSSHVSGFLPDQSQQYVASLFLNSPNKSNEEYLVRGYYENLMDGSRFNDLLNSAFEPKPLAWANFETTDAVRKVADLRGTELVPLKTTVVNGKTITTNRWGMRDRHYEIAKEPGVYRIAILGGSHEMGYGVENDEIFEHLVEERLNRSQTRGDRRRIEMLNFAVNGYSPLSQVEVINTKPLAYKPDMLLFFAHERQIYITIHQLAKQIKDGVVPRYEFVRKVMRDAGVTTSTPPEWSEPQLTRHWQALHEWAYREVVEVCRRNQIQPVWVLMPGVRQRKLSDDGRTLARIAGEAGFQVIDLSDTYGDLSRESLAIAPWDDHPNAAAHRLIEQALYKKMPELDAFKLHAGSGVAAGDGAQ